MTRHGPPLCSSGCSGDPTKKTLGFDFDAGETPADMIFRDHITEETWMRIAAALYARQPAADPDPAAPMRQTIKRLLGWT